jgi:hypothetical protein
MVIQGILLNSPTHPKDEIEKKRVGENEEKKRISELSSYIS